MWPSVVALVTPPIVAVTAAVTNSGPGLEPYTLIGSVVTPVIVVVLLLTNRLHTHGEVARLEADLTRERADNAAMRKWWEDRGAPLLNRSTLVLEGLDASRLRRGGGAGDD